MAKSIRISDRVYDEAVVAASLMSRSLAQQIEHWARLGQSMEATSGSFSQHASLLLNMQHARDEERVRNKEISPESLFLFTSALAKESKVIPKKIDFDEAAREYG